MGRWHATGAMHERREYAGGVRLKDGRILAVSGHPLSGKSIASAELYDPATGKWSDTGSLRAARNGGNEATLLLDGRVLFAGGQSNAGAVRGVELYDPATGEWSNAGALSVGRDPVPTLLADGRVLVTGGIDWFTDGGKTYAIAELYDPVSGKWTKTSPLHTTRYGHQAVLLDDGRVLTLGGYENGDSLLTAVELYDPSMGLWQTTSDLPLPRMSFGLAKLRDGRVLVAGGNRNSGSGRSYLASVVIFDPKIGRWSEAQPMKDRRAAFSITLLPDGQVLVAGGVAESGIDLRSAEIFDPTTGKWRAAAPMLVARHNHRAALLPDGGVLVIGGSNLLGQNYLTSCEIFRLEPP